MEPDALKTLLETMQGMLQTLASTSTQPPVLQQPPAIVDDVTLPYFNPATDNLQKWFAELEATKLRMNWDEWKMVGKCTSYLLGDAKEWIKTWQPPTGDRNWRQLQADMTIAFPSSKGLGELLREAVNYYSRHANSYAEYAREKIARLRRVDIAWTEKNLVDVMVTGISDESVRNDFKNQECQTVAEFSRKIAVRHMQERVGPKQRSKNTEVSVSPRFQGNKRPHHVSGSCFECGLSGHFRRDCPKLSMNTPTQSRERDSKRHKTNLHCGFCKKDGHNEQMCWIKQKSNAGTHHVNLCKSFSKFNSCAVIVQGHKVMCLLDTGSSCSLIVKSLAQLLKCEKAPTFMTLRGIGGIDCVSTEQINVLLEFQSLQCNATLYVVPDGVITVDIIVGTDVFSLPGITLVSDENGVQLFKKPDISIELRNFVYSLVNWNNIVTDLLEKDKDRLIALLRNFSDIITTGNAVSTVKTGELHIRTKDDTVVRYQPYRLSFSERESVKTIVNDLLKNGIIRESESPYASPIILVKKKDSSLRMCVDFRALNRLTIKDRYPLPLIDDQLDRLGKGVYFTTLDMASGFHQIPIHHDSVHKTAFVTPDGQFEYVRMPFGLCNAPAVFQRAINKALGTLTTTGVALVYLDDVLIPSTTVEEGLDRLGQVLTALRDAGFSLNLVKCSFLMNSVEYLGREVSKDGIKPGKRKVQALINSPVPTNVHEVRQFLGLASYFRKFVPDFASRTSCISRLTRNNEPWQWNVNHESARQYVLNILTSEPLLTIFDPNLDTELHTDASSLGYGAILFQKHDNGMKVVAYFSRRTSPVEARYHSYELETLAAVNAMKNFRHYLIGVSFVLVTDCNALKATKEKKDLLPRVARWWIYLQDFSFTIEYRKGSSLAHVDYLSRNPVIETVNIIQHNESWIEIEQKQDPETQDLLRRLAAGDLDKNQYVALGGILYHKVSRQTSTHDKQWFVPRKSRLSLLRTFHDEQCHVGQDKTLDSLFQRFWFPHARRFVAKYIKHCLTCVIRKTSRANPRGLLHSYEKVSQPFHTLHVDYIGTLPETSSGLKYVCVFVDAFSKFCVLYCLENAGGRGFRQSLKNVVALFGTPTRLIVDEASGTTDYITKTLCEVWKIELHIITPHVHRSNGQVERQIRTINNMLRIETTDGSEWSRRVWKIQLVLNSTVQKTIKTTPLQLLFGCDGTVPAVRALLTNMAQPDFGSDKTHNVRSFVRDMASANILANKTDQDDRFNKNRENAKNFEVGSFVVLKTTKRIPRLGDRLVGPFEVIEVLENDRYRLRNLRTRRLTRCSVEEMVFWPGEWFPEDLTDSSEGENDTEKIPGVSGNDAFRGRNGRQSGRVIISEERNKIEGDSC